MAFIESKSGRIIKASLPRKLPKCVIEEVEKGNATASAFAKKAQMIIPKAK